MPKITHIAVRVNDIEAMRKFYEEVFGFEHVNTVHREGAKGSHISCHLSDGTIDLSLLQYENDGADEADLAGPPPCIHHFGIEVDDMEGYQKRLEAAGGEVVSAPGKLPVKFRTPGGPIAEIIPVGRYKKKTLSEGVHGPVIE